MIITFVITLFLAAVLQIFLPWWSVVIAAFVAGYLSQTTAWHTFLAASAAIAVLWLGFALAISLFGSTVLLPKISTLMNLPHPVFLYLLTMLVGALPAGLAALSAFLLRESISPYDI